MKTTEDYIISLRDFKTQYADEYAIEKMGIFGSIARGEHNENSDVDVYYEGKALGLKSLVELPSKLEAYFGRHVDVIRSNSNIRQKFLDKIMKDVIYV
ncbi:MAG: nucleotidyltransferase domain-containing protein [Bacteroidales bacterium]|nr:nucleotidyltransferase domain-containing protein [Bacteroidales bacterium]